MCRPSRGRAQAISKPPPGGRIFAPAKLPPESQPGCAARSSASCASDAFKDKLGDLGVRAGVRRRGPSRDFQQREIEKWGKAVRDSGASGRLTMQLNDEEQAMLAGELGPSAPSSPCSTRSKSEIFSARRTLCRSTQAHVMADTESLGEAGVGGSRRWRRSRTAARRVRIPTITDPRGTDFAKARSSGRRPGCSTWSVARSRLS